MPFCTRYRSSPMAMTLLPALLCLVAHFTDSNAGIVTSPGLQRKSRGQTCTFQWTVNEPIVKYSLYNRTTGAQMPLSLSGSYSSANGVITLTIVNVQLWDAGNYSVEVTTNKTTYTDANACLFVYGNLQGSVAITVGTNSPTEGDTVELACNFTSNSLPVTYKPDIYYTWSNSKYGQFQYISNGTAVRSNGDLLPGYAVKNNGRTLRISSVQYPDDQYVYCYGSEDVVNNGWSSFYFSIPLRYKPYSSSLNPANKKFNAFVSSTVALSFYVQANPPITSITNWTFVNSAGISQDLPPDSVESGLFLSVYNSRPSLQFNFTSDAFYGTYSITLTNDLGSTITAFQVLPQSRPDAPSNLALYYFSHNFVYIQWNLMSSNVLIRQQTVITRLTQSDNEIQTYNVTYYDNFNATVSYTFNSNIQALTYYKVSVWSTNSLGSSEIVELKFKTRDQPRLTVLPEMIQINGTQAIVNFTVEMGENTESVTSVQAQCCSRFSTLCVFNSTKYTVNQIVLSNIPNGTEYFVDVTIYCGIYTKYNYFADIVKGVRVSRNGTSDSNDCEVNQRLLAGVIVLASLLGVAVVVAMAILSVYLVKRSRRERRQPIKPPPIPSATYLDKKQNALAGVRPQSNGSDVYEPVQ